MSLRAFFLVMAVGALVTSTTTRVVDLSDGTAYAVSMTSMAALMLICFPFMDPKRNPGRGSRRH